MKKNTILIALLFVTCALWSQMTNGTISGTLVDPSGSAVVGAPVTLRNPARSFTLNTTADNTGRFLFPSVPPGDYTLHVAAPGFKTLDRVNVVLNVNQRLTMGDIQLDIGAVTETIEVTDETVTLKTESAERSSVLSARQMENIAVNGRSYLALAGLTPGVVATGNFQVAGTSGLANISANGARTNQNQLLLNGISNVDTGNNGDQLATISIDSVQEFRILTGVYQAEYGRSAGAQIIVQTRSGTNQFHGSGYYYRRHDSMNANAWNRNRDNQPRQLYRFQNPGYTVGGPVMIPGVFERLKDKLFFFWSQEYQRQLQPENVRRVRLPTALERTGDFSQSLDQAGRVIPSILDPVSRLPFANSRVPTNRIFAPGQALLNFFPEPNRDQAVFLNYNYETQISTRRPRREDLIRIDYNLSDTLRLWGHYINNNNLFTSPYGSFVLGSNLGIININDGRPGKSYASGLTWVVSPVMTTEFTFGFGRNDILIEPSEGDTPLTRSGTGINLPLLYPDAVQRDFFPSFSFNGTRLTNQPTIGTNNAPFVNYNDTSDFSSNTTRLFSGHTLKFGAYVQFSRKNQTSFANANGNYNFGDSPNNPFDTNFGYSNALLGVYNTFQQAGAYANGQYRYYNVETYLQDTWKLTRRLTFDYGLRMAWIQPQHDVGLITSSFSPNAYNASSAVRLYERAANGQAIDPVTGQTLPSFAIGRVVPGSGNFTNGIVQPGKEMNKYLMRDRGIHWGPRFGLALDVLGNQSMVLRLGGGVFYDRFQGNRTFDLLTNPPTVVQPLLTFGLANEINPASALVGPPSLVMADPTGVVPTVYNFSAGLQTKLPFNVVLDTAYVGALSRHLQNNRNVNAVPYGATFTPSGAAAPNADFLRPYRGFGNINIYEGTVSSNYNSLQLTASRRFASTIIEMNYTWSRALGTAQGDGDFQRIDSLNRFANYGLLDFHRQHNLNLNFVYEIPNVAKAFGNQSKVADLTLGGWQVSGIYQYTSGNPQTIGFNIPGISNPQLTGSFTEGARIWLVGDPTAGISGKDPYFNINPDAYRAPLRGSIGVEAPNRYFILPGVNNWNMSVTKIIRFREGREQLQFRADAFNAFNHTQFSDYNRTLNFRSLADPTPTNVTRGPGGFGAVSGFRDPRILQLMVRFQF